MIILLNYRIKKAKVCWKIFIPISIYWKNVCFLFVLRLNVPVNNFSVMSGRSHRFLGITVTGHFEIPVISYPGHFVPFWSFRTCTHFIFFLVISYPVWSFRTQFGHFVPTFIFLFEISLVISYWSLLVIHSWSKVSCSRTQLEIVLVLLFN